MKSMERIFNAICSTDSLPVIGGAGGALSSGTMITANTVSHLPTHESVIVTVVLAAIGAVVGYLIKLLLDHLVDVYKNKKSCLRK